MIIVTDKQGFFLKKKTTYKDIIFSIEVKIKKKFDTNILCKTIYKKKQKFFSKNIDPEILKKNLRKLIILKIVSLSFWYSGLQWLSC